MESAGDLDALAIHPAEIVRDEAGNHPADIIGKADPAEGGLFRDEPVEVRIVPHQAAPKSVSMAPGATLLTRMPRAQAQVPCSGSACR